MKTLLVSLALLATLGCTSSHGALFYKIVKGNLFNLPDGKMYIINDQSQKIDSVTTSNGLFLFKLPSNDDKKYAYATLEHLDKAGTRRIFQFKTNRTYNREPLLTQFFIVGDTINISGILLDFVPKDLVLPSKIKLVYPSEFVSGGIQNTAMININYNFSSQSSDSNYTHLKRLIIKHPNSYYLLREIAIRKSNFSSSQLREFLSLFSKDLQGYEETISLRNAVAIKEGNVHTIRNTKLKSTKNTLKNIIDSAASVNMVVLWASWCGPCVAEIPDLKNVYEKYKNNSYFYMVSISLDTEKKDWEKALKKHPMSWSQLWLHTSIAKYGMEIFQFDGSIPTILFLNSEGKLLKKFTGYQKSNFNKYVETISYYLNLDQN